MRWMDIAWTELGVKETAGPDATPEILEFFREAHRGDVVSDETAWCAAFVFAVLSRAGVEVALPKDERLLARSYLKIGTGIHAPRVGALCVIRRGAVNDGWSGHVFFVTGWTDTHVKGLGGNQSDAVTEDWFPREKVLGYRWPEPPPTARQLAAAGSRHIATARSQQMDAAKGGGLELTEGPVSQALEGLAATLGKAHASLDTIAAFVAFLGRNWWQVAAVGAVYYFGRVAWNAWQHKQIRIADAATGANTGRDTLAPGV